MGISDGIPAFPRNRKLSEFGSNPSAEEKKNLEFRPWNKNRSNSRNSFSNLSAEDKTTQNS